VLAACAADVAGDDQAPVWRERDRRRAGADAEQRRRCQAAAAEAAVDVAGGGAGPGRKRERGEHDHRRRGAHHDAPSAAKIAKFGRGTGPNVLKSPPT
jgi:hypothetical protein